MLKRLIYLILVTILLAPRAEAVALISDEETESFLYDVLQPVFRAAGLPLSRNYVHIVKDDSLNAFVGDRNHMFVHTGTLLKAANANEIQGVLAHETGHILGGHILRLKVKIQDMQKATLASLVAAGAAAVASGRGDAAIAVVMGTQSSALNAMTAYQMTEERAADETAVMLMHQNNQSVRGLKDFMGKIQSDNRLQGIEESPYFRTHPITTERIAFFEERLKREGALNPNPTLDKRFKRIQAKLTAYLWSNDKVLRRYPLSDTSVEATIAHAVYFMRLKQNDKALAETEKLIALEPANPYFYEIKAQTLFEGGQVKAAAEAYKKTLSLRPQALLFKLAYAEALLATEPSPSEAKTLIPLLEGCLRQGGDIPAAYLYLGQVYSRLGQECEATYFAAEYALSMGEEQTARRQLDRALKCPLRADIKLRAEDMKEKLTQDKKKGTLL